MCSGVDKVKNPVKTPLKNNHIEEYFDVTQGNKSSELFRISEPEDIDLKTDLSENEIKIITTLHMTDEFLIARKIPRVFDKYVSKYLRLRVSKDRQGRGEFVTMNSSDNTSEILDRMGNVSNIVSARK